MSDRASSLVVNFDLQTDTEAKQLLQHHFIVKPTEGPPVLGASYGGLTFEPVIFIDL